MSVAEASEIFTTIVILGALGSSLIFLWAGFSANKRANLRGLKRSNSNGVTITNSHSLSQVAHRDAKITALYEIIFNNNSLLPKPLAPGRALSRSAASLAMSNLEYLVRSIALESSVSPHLFGVNKGGGLVSTWIGHRLQLHEKYLVKCDWNTELEKEYIEPREFSGPIIILDDLSRTGSTLTRIHHVITKKYPQSMVYCMVLVSSTKNMASSYPTFSGTGVIDYAAWLTEDETLELPWSSSTSNEIDANDFFDDTEMDQVGGRITIPPPNS